MQAQPSRGRSAGFTLVELLVVIAILGVLGAVVVVSVSGVRDRGEAVAADYDARTLRTAEEAYYARFSTYATEAQLITEGFLASESSYHDIQLYGSGPASLYRVVCGPGAGGTACTAPVDLGALKPQIKGLADRQGMPADAELPVVNTFVVKADWADLQPVAGGAIVPNNDIDDALHAVRALNGADPALNMRVKLRVYAGEHSPDWAKTLDGPPITICDPDTPAVCGTMPRFWTDRFRDAYNDLQARLAALYDGAPEILQTTIARCTTFFAEPFLRQAALATNLEQYQAAGYTPAADQRCQQEQVQAHGVWTATRSALAFNPYQAIDTGSAPAQSSVDGAFTEAMMAYCRAVLGPRCVVGNNSVLSGSRGPEYDSMYTALAATGAPLYIQTATLDKVGDLGAAISFATSLGASLVELPLGYETVLTPAELAAYDAGLEASVPPGG